MKPRERPTIAPALVGEGKYKVPEEAPIKYGLGFKIWKWWNGKKTLIGAVLAIPTGIAAPFLVPPWSLFANALFILGDIIGGIGLVHKGQKFLNKKTSGDKVNWNEIIDAIFDFLKSLTKRS